MTMRGGASHPSFVFIKMEIWLVFFVGLALGSLANVLIYRLPRGESVIYPPSHCPVCSHRLGILDNIPLLSFLFLRGKCRYCQNRISWRYPVVELTIAVYLVLLFLHFSWGKVFLYAGMVSFLLLVIVFIDWEKQIIPDLLSLGLLLGGLVSAFYNPFLGSGGLKNFFWSLLGLVLGGGILWMIAFFGRLLYRREALGGGDIKLGAALGSIFGAPDIVNILGGGIIVGGIFGGILLLTKKKSRLEPIPFGPFLAIGTFVHIFFPNIFVNKLFLLTK